MIYYIIFTPNVLANADYIAHARCSQDFYTDQSNNNPIITVFVIQVRKLRKREMKQLSKASKPLSGRIRICQAV